MPDNSGISVLPQFNGNLPVDPGDAGNPLNSIGSDAPTYFPPPVFGSAPAVGAPSNARNYPIPGTQFNPPSASLPSGVTPSAGGWNIDANGNLVNNANWIGTGQDVGRSVGNFIGTETGRMMGVPGLGMLGGFFGRQAGSLIGHGIGGLFGSISHGLGKLFGHSDTAGTQDSRATTAQSAAAARPSMPNFSTVFNANRGAFSPTYQQLNNPGSPIGPTSGLVGNPYGMNNLGFHNGLARAGPEITSIPAFAQATTNYILQNKQR